MRLASLALLLALGLVGSATFIRAHAASPGPVAPRRAIADQADDHPGAQLLVRMCNTCHDSARIIEQRRTKDDWQQVLVKMIEYGAFGDPQEFETLHAYLCLNHGLVYINSAPAFDIAMTLGLPSEQAAAIVSFRTEHGAFADLDAVKQVPNVDVKAIDLRKDAVRF